MIPHKTKRGAAALARLKVYEGVPPPYAKTKRVVVPDALKVLRLQKGHKYSLLGRLSKEVGWNHYDTIKELEEKRKARSQEVYQRKKHLNKLRVKAEKAAEEKLGAQIVQIRNILHSCLLHVLEIECLHWISIIVKCILLKSLGYLAGRAASCFT